MSRSTDTRAGRRIRSRSIESKTWRMPFATVATGRRLFYERGGAPSESSPSLLFIDGTGSDLRDGSGQRRIAALEKMGFDVIVFDHRGLGRSADPADTRADRWTMADFADDAAGLINVLLPDGRSCHVVGWSFGGMVAQELAVRHPSLVQRLVLACTSAGGKAGASFPLHELEDLPETERAARMIGLLDTRDEPTDAAIARALEFAAAARAREAATPGAAVGKELQLAARAAHDTTGGLPGLTCRALVVSGENDGIAPAEPVGRALAALVAGSRFQTFAGGHLLLKFGDVEQQAWEAIANFLLHEPGDEDALCGCFF